MPDPSISQLASTKTTGTAAKVDRIFGPKDNSGSTSEFSSNRPHALDRDTAIAWHENGSAPGLASTWPGAFASWWWWRVRSMILDTIASFLVVPVVGKTQFPALGFRSCQARRTDRSEPADNEPGLHTIWVKN